MTHLSIAKPPATLWQTLADCHDFPVLEESRERIRQQMHNRSVSFEDLASSIERDPALCLHLLRLSVERHPGCNEQISGAASCLSLLGMQELVKLMKQLPVVSAETEDPAAQLYRNALLTAQLAGNLAAVWAASKGNTSVSYARWSTMLTSAPLWLALLNYKPAQNWLHLLSRGCELAESTRAIFGSQLSAIQKLNKQLSLPVMATAVFNKENWPDAEQWRVLRHHDPRDLDNQRPLLHHCQQPAMISLMANSLAWHWHIAPDGRHSKRWQTLVSHWLGKPQHMLQPELRQLQVQTSKQQHSGISTGLQLLLSPQPAVHEYPWIDAENAAPKQPVHEEQAQPYHELRATPAVNAEPEERHSDDKYMKKLLRQLQQEPDSFGDWHYLMRGMLKGVCEGIGLSAACIALLNKDKTVLKVFYAEGMSEQAPMRRFVVDLRKPSLFNKLLEKQSSLLLNSDNRQRFLQHLPAATSELIPQQTMMMSIDAGAAPIGLVMGFAAEHQPELSQAEYISFKNLCQVTSQSLATLKANTEKRRRAAANHGQP